MNFFTKKIKIKYFNLLEKEDAKDMIKTIPNNFPRYFFSIPKTQFNPEKRKFIPYQRTIKTCSGFINLYKRSLLLTSPFDIYLEFNDNQIINQQVGQTNFECANIHGGERFLNYVPNNKKFKFILKIELPFVIDSNISLMLSKSDYHFNDFDVLPGILSSKYKDTVGFFVPIEKEKNEFYIKKGDPLCLLTPLCENKIKLKFEKFKQKPQILTFSTLKKFNLKNLI